MTTIVTVSKSTFQKMQEASSNQAAWTIFHESLNGEECPTFIGGFDCADWKENEVLFQDRGKTTNEGIRVNHIKIIAA